ncbi:cytosine permease [bacterium]|nr:cytosine permease [bacterium]
MEHSGLKPIATEQRRLGSLDLGLIWFGAAIAITEIWAGGLPGLTSVGLLGGLAAILLGRIVGNGLMALLAHTGAVQGLPTMALARPVYGRIGSLLPSFFNVLQLVGWTGFMLFVGAGYLDTLAGFCGLPSGEAAPGMRLLWVALLAGLCVLWSCLFGSSPLWKWVERGSGLALFALTLGMTFIVLRSADLARLLEMRSGGALAILAAMDLVIAMSVSWLPLVADYSRYARSPQSASRGTFWGYFIGGSWMYAVGLLLALDASRALVSGGPPAPSPDMIVIELLGRTSAAWAILAICLVLLSTVTTTFLDIYSTSISAQNILPRLPVKVSHFVVGLLGALIALTLSVEAYEPFLLAIGSIFLPAFSIVIAHYWLVRRDCSQPAGTPPALRWTALLAWLLGFLVYDWAGGFPALRFVTAFFGVNPPIRPWETGASLPCILVSTAAYLLLSLLFREPGQKPAGDLAVENGQSRSQVPTAGQQP